MRGVAAALVGGLVVACGAEPSSPPLPPASGANLDRGVVLGGFLSAHWQLPVPAQGAPPARFSPEEASLDPAVCGTCHPKQYAEWRTSWHATAFSPGFAGQLLEGSLAAPAAVRQCQTCHAPLAEQLPGSAEGTPNPTFDAGLRAQGIVCAACHVRAHRRYGPLRRAELPPPAAPLPHDGFEARAEFGESRFCAACHQFFEDPGVAGKPLENTWAEWRASPQAAAGRTCQSCHMPDRAHLWRGIHDAETVRQAVDVELRLGELADAELRATLVVRNRDVGHRFPTYVTPRVVLAVWQETADGRELPDTRLETTLGRSIDFGATPWRERFDTRVAPGETAELDYAIARLPAARVVVGRVSVDPDHHYRDVFASLLASYTQPEARRLIAEAAARARDSAYVLAERRAPLPAASGP